MFTDLLNGFIATTARLGLHYEFLASAFEVKSWLDGVMTTLLLVVISIPLSLVFGLAFVAAVTSGRGLLAVPVRAYIELTRNTPTLVQLACAFYVINMLIAQALGGAQHNPLKPIFWVIAVTSLHTAALHAEALRAGIEAIPASTIEAARAIGFSRVEILRFIELPLALRSALPSIVNNLINLVKLTTIGSAIAVGEVTYASIMIWTQRDNVLELMILILILFSTINFVVARLGAWVEWRLTVPGYGR